MNHHRDGQKPVEQTETLWAFELFAEELPKQVDFTHLSSLACASCLGCSCAYSTAASLGTFLPN